MFGIWNNATWEICNWIQVARSHRSTMILDKLYKAFFHCHDFLHCTYRPDQNLLATFILALQIEFERTLYLHDEGYKTSDDYDLPQPLHKYTCIYAVPSVAEVSFDPTGYKGSTIPAFPSMLKERQAEPSLHWVVCRHLNFDDLLPPAVNSGDDVEEDFPTAPLDDSVWSEEPILNRDLCICMALRKSETSYPSQIPPHHGNLYMRQESKRNLWIALSVICPISLMFPKTCFLGLRIPTLDVNSLKWC